MASENEQLFKVNEVGLTYHKKAGGPDQVITTQKTAVKLLRSVWDDNKIELIEQFKVMLLDTANTCLGIADISSGGLESCSVDPRLIFATALKAKSTQIILAHNHPSGKLSPSDADKYITEKICVGGEILGIRVLDHFILTKDKHVSFAAMGLIPS